MYKLNSSGLGPDYFKRGGGINNEPNNTLNTIKDNLYQYTNNISIK